MTQTEPIVLDAHGKHAQAVAFDRRGRRMFSAGQDAVIRLWSIPDFRPVGALAGHGKSVNTLSLSADDRWLATSSSDGTARVWDMETGATRNVLKGIVNARFSPVGTTLAAATATGGLLLLDGSTGAAIAARPKIDERLVGIAFTANGDSVLLGGTGGIHKLTVKDAGKAASVKAHAGVVAALATSPDGKCLVTTGADGNLKVWSLPDLKPKKSAKLGTKGILQIAFHPKGDCVTVSVDSGLVTYDLKDLKVREKRALPLKGIYGVAVADSGKYLACAAADGRIRIYSLAK